MRLKALCTTAIVALTLFAPALSGARAADKLPAYRQVPGVAGTINSVGSDTLNNLMTFWGEAFQAMYPNVTVQVEGKGSATAPPALAAGAAQLGPMSREMKTSEIEAFEKARGFKPVAIAVAIDCLAVYVNKDNPIPGLTLAQADAIFSSTRKRGLPSAKNWGDLGLTGAWKDRGISCYGRNAASGTYAFFKEHVLDKGDFKDSVKEQPGSAAVVNGIASDLGGIGYSGIGYKTSDVRIVPLAAEKGQPYIEATFDHALDGTYPLARALYIYVPKKPGQPLDQASLEFMRFVLSKEGQELAAKDGYGALPPDAAAEQLDLLNE